MSQAGRQSQVVGIDLGTSNSAVARVLPHSRRLEPVEIIQRLSATEVGPRLLLPSFLYLPGAHELPEGSLELPWDAERDYLVGEFARFQGARVPGRVVASAKSWLAHRKLDPTEPILPWDRAADLAPISPVEASSRYLLHLVESWNHQFPDEPLQNQEVVLTVPASFDELARKLTAGAAADNGLTVRLLEEPQAAFYAWLHRHPEDWSRRVEPGEHVLVCDVGGGTTDFTLIRVGEEELERVAVGDHLMLGGDNLDIALAHLVEPRLGAKLDLLQWGVLRHQCRRAKESLLGDDPPETATVTVPGSGARLLAGALSAEVTREEVEALVLDGFFPETPFELPSAPAAPRKGLREWGLPYESDPAVPRHLARFLLSRECPVPSKVLFNGGACRPAAIRARLLSILSDWRQEPVTELESPDAERAVATGAAWYGWQRRIGGTRIGGGSARSYYLGVSGGQAVCVVPRNLEEGKTVALDEPELHLLVDQPARFPLFSSPTRAGDAPGALVPAEVLEELPPLETVVHTGGKHKEVPVLLSAEVTEVGTLAIWCRSGSKKWNLEFPLRTGVAGGASVELLSRGVREARELVETCFSRKPAETEAADVRPRTLLSALERELATPRDDWSPAVLRAFWDSYFAVVKRRRVTDEYESAWFNGAGYCLRPGFGVPLDDWRMEQMAELFSAWMQFPKEEKVRVQWWIMWRRIAPGLVTARQEEVWEQLSPVLIPGRRHIKTRLKGDRSPTEDKELLRLAVSLERIPVNEKHLLGEEIMKKFSASGEDFWKMARLAARDPMSGAADRVLPPEVVGPWLESILSWKWSSRHLAGLAVAQMGRVTGDRRRDLPEELVERLAQRLVREGVKPHLVALLRGEEEALEEEQAELFGDTLPVGLRLR